MDAKKYLQAFKKVQGKKNSLAIKMIARPNLKFFTGDNGEVIIDVDGKRIDYDAHTECWSGCGKSGRGSVSLNAFIGALHG